MELELYRQIKQSSLSVVPRNSGGQGQLRPDAGEVGGDDDPPYDLCNTLWGWMEKTVDRPGIALKKVLSCFFFDEVKIRS